MMIGQLVHQAVSSMCCTDLCSPACGMLQPLFGGWIVVWQRGHQGFSPTSQ